MKYTVHAAEGIDINCHQPNSEHTRTRTSTMVIVCDFIHFTTSMFLAGDGSETETD